MNMKTYQIAVLPGDGIGPEVRTEAVKVLEALAEQDEHFNFETTEFPWNSDYYVTHGKMVPEDGLEQLKSFDTRLFGAIGDARVDDLVTIWELILPIRKNVRHLINLRSIKQLKGSESPIKQEKPMDFAIIRENSEGEYSDSGGIMIAGEEREMAVQNTVMTRQGIRQLTE